MTTHNKEIAKIICSRPCYIADNDTHNPYRLTLYIADNGAVMLGASGNGCGDDIPLEDIDGWSDADINERFRNIDTNALAANVTELRDAGFTTEAGYVWDWLCHADSARCEGDPCHAHNLTIDLESMGDAATEDDIDKFIEALHEEGYTWARKADGETGDTSGITEREWQRVMDKTFNQR